MPKSTISAKIFQVCLGLTTSIFAITALPQILIAGELEKNKNNAKQQNLIVRKVDLQAQNNHRDLSHNASD